MKKSILFLMAVSGTFTLGYFVGAKRSESGGHRSDSKTAKGASEDGSVQNGLTMVDPDLVNGAHGGGGARSLEEFDEILSDLKAKSPNGYFHGNTLEAGRLLLRAEALLSNMSREAVLGLIRDRETGKMPPELVSLLFGRIAKASPEDAGALWLDQYRREKSAIGVGGVINEWIQRDPLALEQWVDSIADKEARKAAWSALLLPMAELDAEKALARVGEVENTHLTTSVARILGNQLPLEDLPNLADDFLAKEGEDWKYQNQLVGVIQSWSLRDADAAIDWLLVQEKGVLEEHVVTSSLQQMIGEDPAAFAEKIAGRLGEGELFAKIGGQVWMQWLNRPDQADAAMEWFVENGENLNVPDRYYQFGIRNWEEENVQPMLEKIAGLPDYPMKQKLLKGLLYQLRETYPRQAVEFAMEHLPPGGENDSTIASMVHSWVEKEVNPADAIEWVMANMNPGDGRDTTVRFGMTNWGTKDPEAAMAYALQLPESERNDSLWGIALEWPKKDPEGVLNYIKSVEDPATISSFTNRAFWELVEVKGGERALQDASSLPPGKSRQDAMEGLFGGWAYNDAEGAATALREMEKGYLRDVSIGSFSGMVVRTDPKAALAWALEIENANQQKRRALYAGKRWLSNDRKTAWEWIEKNDSIPAAIRAELLKPKGSQ